MLAFSVYLIHLDISRTEVPIAFVEYVYFFFVDIATCTLCLEAKVVSRPEAPKEGVAPNPELYLALRPLVQPGAEET